MGDRNLISHPPNILVYNGDSEQPPQIVKVLTRLSPGCKTGILLCDLGQII